MEEPRRISAIVDEDPRAWEEMTILRSTEHDGEESVGTQARSDDAIDSFRNVGEAPLPEELGTVQTKMAVLRDAILLTSSEAGENHIPFDDRVQSPSESLRRYRWEQGWDMIPHWYLHSPTGCAIAEVRDQFFSH